MHISDIFLLQYENLAPICLNARLTIRDQSKLTKPGHVTGPCIGTNRPLQFCIKITDPRLRGSRRSHIFFGLSIWKNCGRVVEATATSGSGVQVVKLRARMETQAESPINDD